MKKSVRRLSLSRETVSVLELGQIPAGIWPPKAPQTDFNCTETATFSCGCSLGSCH